MEKKRYNRIILFCDYGIDDAVATLHVLKRSELFGKIDIVPIGGNVDVSTAYRNAHTLLAAADVKADIRIIDTRGINQPSASIPDIHGTDGLGDFLEPRTSNIKTVGFDAFAAELKAAATPERDCVLSLGPCTVPVLLGYVPFCTVLMGGAVKEPPNYGDYEFNEALDVEAFKLFSYNATAVATLDTCHDKRFDFEHMKSGDALQDRLIERCLTLCRARGAEKLAVYDYVAALAVTDPERFDAVRIRRADGVEFNELRLAD